MRPNNICCIVIGEYAGWPACCVIASKCPEVRVTVLADEKVITELYSETTSNYDSDMAQIVKKCRNRNLFFSSNYQSVLRDADLVFLSINNSNKVEGKMEENALNLKQLEETLRLIVLHAESDTILVENSRIAIQAMERISAMLPSRGQSSVRFQIISNPGFLMEGSAVDHLLKPERILISCQNSPMSRAAAQSLCELYEQWIPRKNIFILNDQSIELCKLAGNAFIVQRISNMNSLSELCEQTGADISQISYILGRDSRLGSTFLHPSVGFGLYQREVSSLVSMCKNLKLHEAADYWQTVIDMKEYQTSRCFRKIESIIGPPRDKLIAIWGFSFEKNALDVLNSPAIDVCRWLLTENSRIKIYDPKISDQQIRNILAVDEQSQSEKNEKNIKTFSDPYSASANTSAIIICTDWDEFAHLDYSRVAQEMQTPIIFDGNFLNEESLKECGISLYKIGLH